MVKCDDCDNAAAYTLADPKVSPVNYCVDCLPIWLRGQADNGEFPLVEPIEEPAKPKKKSKEVPVAETPVEEPTPEVPADENN